jgi:hypothetical protein
MSSVHDNRQLGEVTREAREDPTPEVDWEAIESRLPMTRVETVPPRALNVRPWLYAAIGVVGAGGLGLRFAQHGRRATTARAPAAPFQAARTTPDLNGEELALGAHVSTSAFPLSVAHAGHARWTLGPQSGATLLTNGELVTVRLDRGTLSARVTKSSSAEAFAVEAADLRVAAHGTEFAVTLGDDAVSVNLTEGSVLVGPRAEPGKGELLSSPSAKRYTLGGLPFDGAVPDAGSPEPAAPEQVSPASLATTTSAVLALAQRCFKARTAAGEGVRVTAQSTLTFRARPDGSLGRIDFEPPLSPSVQACISAGVSAIHAQPTKHGFQMSHSAELER